MVDERKKENSSSNNERNTVTPNKKENKKIRVKFPLYMKKNSNQLFRGAKRRDVEFYREEETPTAQALLQEESNIKFFFNFF